MEWGRARGLMQVGRWCLVLAWAAWAVQTAAQAALTNRDEDPVVVSAASFPELSGTAIGQLALFRYDAPSNGFVPIPFQVDQRVDHVFNSGTSSEVHELMYDVLNEDDGLLDANDELAFLFPDAGDQASAGAVWPPAADPNRFEIRVVDPRPGGPYPDRFVYLFSGSGLAHSGVNYISWTGSAAANISSVRFELDFLDRWLLTGYRVIPPCGSGGDLIDRFKGRAGLAPDRAESEEIWNATSTYLGGLVGPVRAIRYVRGAASGVNTVHHDVVYRGFWERVVNLRVHPTSGVWFYLDLLPAAGTSFLASTVPAGVPVDGVNDASVGTTIPDWAIIRGSGGGMATIYNIPPSPFYGTAAFYYRDDASYDDKPQNVSTYGDDDNSAYGNHGIHLDTLTGGDTDTISTSYRLYPLCSNQGDATLGAGLRALLDYPLQTIATRQSQAASAIRTLVVARTGLDVVLSWQPAAGALSYRVYGSTTASLPQGSWTLLGTPTGTVFTDTGAAGDGVSRFYSVTAVGASGEGPW
jgi:hypothetical protein